MVSLVKTSGISASPVKVTLKLQLYVDTENHNFNIHVTINVHFNNKYMILPDMNNSDAFIQIN